MPLIEGDLSTTPVQGDDTPSISLQLARGVEHLHSKNTVHRDLKPSNILLETKKGPPVVKIADVGTAKIGQSLRKFTGTSYFMAPELIRRVETYSAAVDMWSLGVVILQLLNRDWKPDLTWDTRFAPSETDHDEWVCADLRPAVSHLNDNHRLMLEGLLCTDPQKRWSAKQLRLHLEDEQENEV